MLCEASFLLIKGQACSEYRDVFMQRSQSGSCRASRATRGGRAGPSRQGVLGDWVRVLGSGSTAGAEEGVFVLPEGSAEADRADGCILNLLSSLLGCRCLLSLVLKVFDQLPIVLRFCTRQDSGAVRKGVSNITSERASQKARPRFKALGAFGTIPEKLSDDVLLNLTHQLQVLLCAQLLIFARCAQLCAVFKHVFHTRSVCATFSLRLLNERMRQRFHHLRRAAGGGRRSRAKAPQLRQNGRPFLLNTRKTPFPQTLLQPRSTVAIR